MLKVASTLMVVAALCLAGACKKDKDKSGDKTPDKTATGKTTEPTKTPPPAPAELTQEALARRVTECYAADNAHEWDKLAACYAPATHIESVDMVPPIPPTKTPEATVELSKAYAAGFPDGKYTPQLTLINGKKSAVVALAAGTNTGEMMGMKPTGKPVSLLYIQTATWNDKGQMTRGRVLFDQATMLAQLGIAPSKDAPAEAKPFDAAEVVMAKNDDAEKANLAAVQTCSGALSAGKLDEALAMIADDVTFHYVPSKEVVEGKDAYKKSLEQFMGMSDDMKMEVKSAWAAGDWVVAETSGTGTLKADMPGAKGSKGKAFNQSYVELMKLEDGKIAQHWVFANNLKFAADVGLVDPAKLAGGQ